MDVRLPVYIFDCEGDSLTPTKFHVLSYSSIDNDKDIHSITSHNEMKEWLLQPDITLIGQNICRWDIPELEHVLDIKIEANLVDTMGLSWYLWDNRHTHNLADWGEELGIKKPGIKDWKNLSLDKYIERCEEDVKITQLLWRLEDDNLQAIYKDDVESYNLPIVKYLSFKLHCAYLQEESKWKVDLDKVKENIEKLTKITNEQGEILRALLPPVPIFNKKEYPKKPYKKNGELSETGLRWQKYLSEQGLTNSHTDPILVLQGYEEPNPASPIQVKDYLFSLGWEPATFNYVNGKDGSTRAIPQIKKRFEAELCDSVKDLFEIEPRLTALEGYSIGLHRIGVLKGFLRDEENSFLKARVTGFTNTLRFQHTELVNLPSSKSLYFKEIRECLVAREGYELVGSDQTALEDLTKRHFMYPHDPDFVNEMSHPNYDPHLSLAASSGAIPEFDLDDIDTINKFKKLYNKERQDYKKTGYSGLYGIGKDKLSKDLKTTVAKANSLLKDYWKKNWSVKAVADEQKVINVRSRKWLYNPVSKFYYSLRNEKDRFSTLNQSTGVYCFDRWIKEILKEREQLTAQFHDEIILEIKKGNRDNATSLLQRSMDKVNESLNLNVKLSISIEFGNNYSEIH